MTNPSLPQAGIPFLNRIPRPYFRLFGRAVPSYHVTGIAGWALALVFSLLVGPEVGIPFWSTLVVAGLSIGSFFGLNALEYAFHGKDNIVQYRHLIGYAVLVTVWLAAAGLPLLRGLDVYLLAFGIFLAFGRLGCFLVGCCHGKPCRHGVCYDDRFRGTGFDTRYVGIVIFPTQLTESVLTALTVVAGTWWMFSGAAAGTPGVFYLSAYAAFRFLLEFYRGDSGRPHWLRFSEAQWTGFGVVALLAVFGALNVLPLVGLPLAVLAGMVAVGIIATVVRRNRPAIQWHLAYPEHLHELVDQARQSHVINKGLPNGVGIRKVVNCTSWGLHVSADTLKEDQESVPHYAISMPAAPLSVEGANMIAQALGTMRHPRMKWQVVEGGQAVYHLLYHPR